MEAEVQGIFTNDVMAVGSTDMGWHELIDNHDMNLKFSLPRFIKITKKSETSFMNTPLKEGSFRCAPNILTVSIIKFHLNSSRKLYKPSTIKQQLEVVNKTPENKSTNAINQKITDNKRQQAQCQGKHESLPLFQKPTK